MIRFNQCFFRPIFCKIFSLMEIWGWLVHFSITNLLCIYDYMLKSELTVDAFDFSTFSMLLCLFSLHLNEVFTMTHNFWKKAIVYHCLTVVKQFGTTINTKFTTVNY